jgi:hypothetical protein
MLRGVEMSGWEERVEKRWTREKLSKTEYSRVEYSGIEKIIVKLNRI